jgi:glutathione peroxidase
MSTSSIYDIPVNKITGEGASLADYRGKVILVVNVASKCGLTPSTTPSKNSTPASKTRALPSAAFPPMTSARRNPAQRDIQAFCRTTFNVDFPMFSRSPSPAQTPIHSTRPSSPPNPKP